MSYRLVFFILLPLLLQPYLSRASQPFQLAELDQQASRFLQEHQADENLSALSVQVSELKSDQTWHADVGTLGKTDLRPISDTTLFQIGSFTKSYIAAIILQLSSEPNKLRLDESITHWLPEFSRWKQVSIRMLLNMSSGIPDHFKIAKNYQHYLSAPGRNHDKLEWLNEVYRFPLSFKPGTKFAYSNTNYILLGLIIERVTQQTLSQVLQSRLLKPLKLNETYYSNQLSASLRKQLAHGYQWQRGFAQQIPQGTDVSDYNLSYLDAAGSMFASNNDVRRWFKSLFTTQQVLNIKQRQQLLQPYFEGYALGVNVTHSKLLHTVVYSYQGMTLGYRALYIYIPKYDLFISILANSSYEGKENHLLALANEIAVKALGII